MIKHVIDNYISACDRAYEELAKRVADPSFWTKCGLIAVGILLFFVLSSLLMEYFSKRISEKKGIPYLTARRKVGSVSILFIGIACFLFLFFVQALVEAIVILAVSIYVFFSMFNPDKAGKLGDDLIVAFCNYFGVEVPKKKERTDLAEITNLNIKK